MANAEDKFYILTGSFGGPDGSDAVEPVLFRTREAARARMRSEVDRYRSDWECARPGVGFEVDDDDPDHVYVRVDWKGAHCSWDVKEVTLEDE